MRPQGVEDQVPRSVRVVAEDRAHGRVEVDAVRRLPQTVDLLAIASHPIRPGARGGIGQVPARVDVRIVPLDIERPDQVRAGIDDRPQAAIALRLSNELRGLALQADGISGPRGRVPRGDDRPSGVQGSAGEGAEHVEADERLVAERDDDGLRRLWRVHRRVPAAPEGGREATPGVRVRDRSRRPPLDVGSERGRGHDDRVIDACLGEPIEDVLQDRPAIESGLELAAPEA